jgi:hypothetical protein
VRLDREGPVPRLEQVAARTTAGRFFLRQYGHMSPSPHTPDLMPLEAEKIWIAVVAEAPNAWRARATSAAGLLSAAAAAALTGLLLRGPNEQDPRLTILILSAAVSYVLAVVLLLSAGVWPSPPSPPTGAGGRSDTSTQTAEEQNDYVSELTDYCKDEAKTLRHLTIAGSIAGAVAVVVTALAALVSLMPRDQPATVQVTESSQRSALAILCPKVRLPMSGTILWIGNDRLSVTLPAGVCGPGPTTIVIPRTSALVATVKSQ